MGLGKIYGNVRDYLLVWPFGYAKKWHERIEHPTAKVLTLNNIEVVYDHVSLAIKGVSIDGARGRHGRAAGRQRRRQEHAR